MKLKPLFIKLKSQAPFFGPSKKERQGLWATSSGLKFSHYQGDLLFDLGRSSRGLQFRASDKALGDEFSWAVGHLIESGCSQKACELAAARVYARYQVELELSAAALLGYEAKHELAKYPAWALVLPWSQQSIGDRYEKYPSAVRRNRSAHGLIFPDSSLWTDTMLTAYGYEAAMCQILQFKSLLEFFKAGREGSLASLPEIEVLRKGSEWRWMMSDEGNHRAYIANHLGLGSFHCRVRNVIHRDHAERWPNVQRGLFTVNEAVSIFDSCFLGSHRVKGLV